MYLTFKWLHIIAIISWMCGILYLFRLFIYHSENRGSDKMDVHQLLSLMERRLFRYITAPAMIMSWVCGLAIVFTVPSFASSGWFQAKLFFVIVLTIITLRAGTLRKAFEIIDQDVPSSRRLRWLNELPTILMIIIVGLVVFKPF